MMLHGLFVGGTHNYYALIATAQGYTQGIAPTDNLRVQATQKAIFWV